MTKSAPPPMGQDLNGDDDNDDYPFELKEQAEQWLQQQLPTEKKANSSDSAYTPYNASRNGVIPQNHWDKAFEEFWRRFMDDTNTSDCDTGPSVLLVATGVNLDWNPGDGLRKAKFLFFPNLSSCAGGNTKTSALFITYMPGPEHGEADANVNDCIGHWRRTNDLNLVLGSGLSSGNHDKAQPDRRVYPSAEFRDGSEDIDRDNGNVAYSRLIWEVEYKNRNPVDIRMNGKKLMKSTYNRLYLAAKIYTRDPEDGETEAAIVLWGRTGGAGGNSDDIQVLEAIDFGTKDLSEEHKSEFAGSATRWKLVGVPKTGWQRPQVLPPNYPRPFDQGPTPDEFVLKIPVKEIVYKTLISPSRPDDTPKYLTELLANNSRTFTELTIDLRELLYLVRQIQPQPAASAPSSKKKAPSSGKKRKK